MLKLFFKQHPFIVYTLGILLSTLLCGLFISNLFLSGSLLLLLSIFILYLAVLSFLVFKVCDLMSEDELDMYTFLENKIENLKNDYKLLPEDSDERLDLLKRIKVLIDLKEEIDNYE